MALNKNPGPPLTSVIKGSKQSIITKWLAKLGLTIVTRKQPTDVNPDAISSTIIESTAEQDYTNERNKTVTTLGNPSGVSMTEKFMFQGLEATRTLTMPTEGAALTIGNTTVEGQQDVIGNGNTQQQLAAVASWPSMSGQELDRTTGIINTFTLQRKAVGSDVGTANVESEPEKDFQKNAWVKTVVPNTAALDAFYATFPGNMDLRLPDELVSIEVLWAVSVGDGDYSEDASGSASGSDAQLSLSVRGNSSGSASVLPEIKPTYNPRGGDSVPFIDYYFFLATPVNRAAILSKVSTLAGESVTAWPVLRARSDTLVLKGQKGSVGANVAVQSSASLVSSNSSTTSSSGEGEEYDIGDSIRAVELPRTIHGSINIADTTKTEVASASAANAISGSGMPSPSASASATLAVEGEVSPSSLPATTPSSIPSSGLYMLFSNVELYRDGHCAVRARVVDAATF